MDLKYRLFLIGNYFLAYIVLPILMIWFYKSIHELAHEVMSDRDRPFIRKDKDLPLLWYIENHDLKTIMSNKKLRRKMLWRFFILAPQQVIKEYKNECRNKHETKKLY